LLARIAGSFSVVPLNILSADVFTRGDHTVLDIFRVCDTKGQALTDQTQIDSVQDTLRKALEDEEFDFAPLLEKARRHSRVRAVTGLDFPTSIALDNKAHPACTLLQIETPDRLGLLYDLLSALGQQNLNIVLSRISTQSGAAIDTFYVTDNVTRGKITDSHRLNLLQQRLQSVILKGSVS